jgi:hypothetical protein
MKNKYYWPDENSVNGSGDCTHPAAAMIVCFRTIGEIIVDAVNDLKLTLILHTKPEVEIQQLKQSIAFVKKFAISSKCTCSVAAVRNCLHCEAESIAQQANI